MKKQTTARITIGFIVVFFLVLAVLHFLEPEYNAEGHLISEYELGQYGWLMSLAFFSLAGASLAICIAIKGDLQGLGGRIGKWWLFLIAIAYLGAGLFYPDDSTGGLGLPLDPAEWKRGTVAPTLNASLHGLAGVIVIASSPIVFSLLQRNLAKNPEWAANIRTIRCATVAAWMGFLLFPLTLTLYNLAQQPGGFDFRTIVSIVNRIMILAYAAWMAVIARLSLEAN
jgi:Protein of unknown function (DUF998)